MSRNCGIVLASDIPHNPISPYGKEVLFTPQIRWVGENCTDAGLECVCAADAKGEELLAALPASFTVSSTVLEVQSFLSAHMDGDVFVAPGNRPFIGADIIMSAWDAHHAGAHSLTLLADEAAAPSSPATVFAGGWVRVAALCGALPTGGESPAAKAIWEAIGRLMAGAGCVPVEAWRLWQGDSPRTLARLNETARQLFIDKALDNGVEIPFADGVIISRDAVLEAGAQVLSGSIIRGQSHIGGGAVIGPHSVVSDCRIGRNCRILSSHLEGSVVEDDVHIGPFSRVRPGSHIQSGVRIGNFVEVKNSSLGHGTKVAHLTYVGDADVGGGVNFGCGVVTVNYDGASKYRTIIGDNVFVGCNANLVAPVTVGEGSYVAAGSTVTVDVPEDALLIARCREIIKEGRAKTLRENQKEKAAQAKSKP